MPRFQNTVARDAYHQGQRDALDAVLARGTWRLLKMKKRGFPCEHHCAVAAARGKWKGFYEGLGVALHMRLGKNPNQRIQAALRRGSPLGEDVLGRAPLPE